MIAPCILLIDDNPGDRALIVRAIRRELPQAQIIEVLERISLDRAIQEKQFDVVVTDFQIRWTNGLDVLMEVKERDPNIPVVMFTNTGTEEIAVEAMKLGLDDYILKQPDRYSFIAPAIVRSLERAQIRKQAERLTDERFENLQQHLQSIQAVTLNFLNNQRSPTISDYQAIYDSAQSASLLLQELFTRALPETSEQKQ
jgi:DNA-binding NtrC family response regulator